MTQLAVKTLIEKECLDQGITANDSGCAALVILFRQFLDRLARAHFRYRRGYDTRKIPPTCWPL